MTNFKTRFSTLPKPSIWRRLAAIFYDGFLLIGVLSLATFAYNWVALEISGQVLEVNRANGEIINDLPTATAGIGYQLYLFVVMGMFYCYFWCKLGQTLGMQAWRLKVCQLDGTTITAKQALLRYLCAWLSIALLGLGYIRCLVCKDRRSLHGVLSNTTVILLDKKT